MALAKAGGPLDILLVEDNLADVRLTQEALKDSAVPPQFAGGGRWRLRNVDTPD